LPGVRAAATLEGGSAEGPLRSRRAGFILFAAGLLMATCSASQLGGAGGAGGTGGDGAGGAAGTMAAAGSGGTGGGLAGTGGVKCTDGGAGTTGSGGGVVGGPGGNECAGLSSDSPCTAILGSPEGCVHYQEGVCRSEMLPYCAKCGQPDDPCCVGNRCASGGCCAAGTCRAEGTTCGARGEGAAICNAGACAGCGTDGKQCCPPSAPAPGCTGEGVICDDRTNDCRHCGEPQEICCPGAVCHDPGTTCNGTTCQPL